MIETTDITTATKRFTIDGSDALEERLATLCNLAVDGVTGIVLSEKLEAIVLGGGYGRGQGGVLKCDESDAPYNDLEFYVFIRGNTVMNDRRFRSALTALGERLSPQAGLHIEFKIISAEKLRRSSITMFSYDLVVGHRVVWGDETIFSGCDHHLAAGKIPLHEATRLLLNRCTGLLFAQGLLLKPALSPDDVDFIHRNTAKAQLALGDVVLTVFGNYHWNVNKRCAQLEKLETDESLPWLTEVRRHHSEGAEFKLHPRRAPSQGEDLRAKHRKVSALGRELWLWLENRRLGTNFKSVLDYAFHNDNKCPETSGAKNRLVNLKSFGLGAVAGSRYPRERLLRSLPLLLWHAAEIGDPAIGNCLRGQLLTSEIEWSALTTRYTKIWEQYS